MIHTDGECPLCTEQQLQLNHDDLLECPQCHLQLAVANPLVATVIPKRGKGRFREDQTALPELAGVGIAKSDGGGVLPDLKGMFENRTALESYMDLIAKEM